MCAGLFCRGSDALAFRARPSLLPATVAVLLVTGICLCSASGAVYTPVNPAIPPEQSTNQILSHIYGGTFVPAGVDYTNGVITAHRVQDNVAAEGRGVEPLNLFDFNNHGNELNTGVDTTDQLWTADAVVATAQARYAVYSQAFGYFDGTSGGSYIPIFNVTGDGYNVTGAGSVGNLGGHIWRWARAGGFFTFTSQNSDNPASIDHMVTYRIDFGGGGGNLGSTTVTYLLFWEDKAPNDNPPPDYDYNDLVVEIRASVPDVPEPATATGLAAIAMIAAVRRRR
jgi:hypothetical protein